MTELNKRIISAIVLIVLLSAAYWAQGVIGIVGFSLLFVSIGVYEYQKIVFSHLNLSLVSRGFFFLTCISFLLLAMQSRLNFFASALTLMTTYFSAQIWLLKSKFENDKILSILSLSALGFFYCALLPACAIKILLLKSGLYWFLLLLAVVFTGDVCAYFGGRFFGKKKLMPTLSPSKTVAGAVSGMVGSCLAGALIGYYILETSLHISIPTSLMAAFLAQNGDLIESLMKRVSSVKDSGHLFPGHGGVLDRLDGIYFAAPIVYFAALYSA